MKNKRILVRVINHALKIDAHEMRMARESLLKENIDGEALAWAAERISTRKEQRKIILVVSDGHPTDDATMAHNGVEMLSDHLRQVLGDVAGQEIDVTAICFETKQEPIYPDHILVEYEGKVEDACTQFLAQKLVA